MQKTLKYSLFALLLAATMLSLAACGHQHQYAEAWSTDGAHHWHDYVCEHNADERVPKDGLAPHTYGAPVITDATCTEPGKETRTCTVCGYTMEKTVAATGHTCEKYVTSMGIENGERYLYVHCDICNAPVEKILNGVPPAPPA